MITYIYIYIYVLDPAEDRVELALAPAELDEALAQAGEGLEYDFL